jgi:N-acetylmuramoyl-L-alanine amidase
MGTWHTVRQGEWLSKIAAKYMIENWKEIWEHPYNESLAKRRDPNILFPKDKIYIPDREFEKRKTGEKQTFMLKRPKTETLNLTILNSDDSPMANFEYVLTIGNQIFKGITTDKGEVKVEGIKLTGDHTGKLEFLELGLTYNIGIGYMNPAEKDENLEHYDKGISGIQARLNNLGFDAGENDGVLGYKTHEAIFWFQILTMKRSFKKSTGELDDLTRKEILRATGN